MYWRQALQVLWRGLPPPEEKIRVLTDVIVVPENAVRTQVFKAELPLGSARKHYSPEVSYPPWAGKYFRTCKEAFEASQGAAHVHTETAFVRGDGVLLGELQYVDFYAPLQADATTPEEGPTE